MLTRFVLSALILTLISPHIVDAHRPASEAAAPKGAQPGKEIVSVPMHFWGPRPIVLAKLNGQGPYRFIVDTGCSHAVLIDEGLFKKLGLDSERATPGHGKTDESDPVKVDTIAIGDVTFSNVRAFPTRSGMPSGSDEPMGILGLRLFEDYLVTFDYPNRRFIFESGRLPPSGEGILRCSFDEKYGSILTIQPTVAGIAMNVHIDTGSPAVLALLSKWQKKLPLTSKPVKVGMARTPAGSADVYMARLEGTLKVGDHEFENPKVDFADLGPMLDYDCGNIGSGLLKDFALTVDQTNRRVRLRRGSDGSKPITRVSRKVSDAPYRIGVAFRPGSDRLIVQHVLPGSAGEKGGLKQGDVVIEVNGKPVGDVSQEELSRVFGSPELVVLKVRRGEKILELDLTPKRATE